MGWEPLHIGLKLNMLRLWNKLTTLDNNRISKTVFDWEYSLGVNNWCSEIEEILSEINFGELYDRKVACDIMECKIRSFDDYKNSWKAGKLLKPKLRSYNLFKTDFCTENYVINCDKYIRSHIAQIRSGILPLNIELGRHRNVEVNERKCTVCNLDKVEDEFHFICECPFYTDCRALLYDSFRLKDINLNLLSEKESSHCFR